ncbi:MAG: ABC transporter permease subunit [Actinomycetes bacterium]|jgi:osmoprotectant transport system permease protein|nr:MAG: ABC transporter permease [Actinomycetota bacterium]
MSWLAEFFGDPANWAGPYGIPVRLAEHVGFCALALALAALIAVPLGLVAGHTGRGVHLVTLTANAARALPTLGLLVLVMLLAGVGTLPVLVPLVALAVPPILVNTCEGVRGVDPDLLDAAYGMGLRGRQVLLRVRAPVALPLILLGLRLAAIQVVATATVAAYVGLGGLGRYIIDGLATRDYPQTLGGATLVVLLALAVQAGFAVLERFAVSKGVSRRVRGG